MIYVLAIFGVALFGLGILVGKEWKDIQYQRRIIDLTKEAQDWKDIVNRRNTKPHSPPWPR